MTKFRSSLMPIIIISSFLIFIMPVSAGIYHVFPGDDIKSIIESAEAGSTIYVHAGMYSVHGGIVTTVGNISIIGDSPYTTIIDGNGEISISISGNNSMIKNLTAQNFSSGIYITNNSIIENCISRNNLYSGIVVIGNNSIIRNCIAHDNQAADALNGGIVIDGNSNRIFNCLAYKNGGVGIYIVDGDYNSIENCTASNGVGGAGFVVNLPCENTILVNCIASNNSYFGDEGEGFSVSDHPSNSIIYCNSWGNGDEWGADLYGKSPGVGCISEDPKYTSGPLGSYYLSLGSPCIDRGYLSSEYWGLQYGYVTTNTGQCDTKRVDMGFHYPCNCSVPSLPIGKLMEILHKE
ncbi:TPA: right-handed parallel beta-helix repeat-containing protein [bacterium]|nr:right-handed parallel beta-helix repeat-containing protein [bacterium]